MKKIFTLSMIGAIIILNSQAQSPQSFNYQAVARDTDGTVIASTQVKFRFSILEGSSSGNVVYKEIQQVNTSEYGIANCRIGEGIVKSGVFSSINWATGLYFVKVELDKNGGNNFLLMGTSQLLSVPYALYSTTSGSAPAGITTGDMQYWNGTAWTIVPAGATGQILTYCNGVPMWTTNGVCAGSFECGNTMTITHTAGNVAPITKTINYQTVQSSLTGDSKCWITQNLGASHSATSPTDSTEESAGWYWQFNLPQGYMHDGTTRTPNTPWITTFNESSDWTAANDPCGLLLGNGWRMPTKTEWDNAEETWNNYYDAYGSDLKLHVGGYLDDEDGELELRGHNGRYWSSTQNLVANSWHIKFNANFSYMDINGKKYGFAIRCLRD